MGPQLLASILHQCSKTKSFRHGFSLHAIAIKMGFLSNVIISNHVLNMYAKCGNIYFARQVFDEMSERNVVTWSAMISGYDQAGRGLHAVELFSRMKVEQANEFVFASAVSACASLLAGNVGRKIHAQAVVVGYADVCFVSNSLVSMYMKCGRCSDALVVFRTGSERNTVAYNAVITGLVEHEQVQKAYEMFRLMCQEGVVPNRFSLVALLGSCTSPNEFWVGMELHCVAVKLNLDSIAFVGNVLIMMYSKFNLIEDTEKIFWLIEEKDMISWNTFIAVCCHALDHAKGLSAFSEMIKTHSLAPDDFTYTSALSACSGLASSIYGRQIHGNLIRTRLSYDTGVANALVNMYAKCGSIKHAVTTFNHMGFHNLVSWNTLMAGFANHGYGEQAIELFDRMMKLKVKPDSVTFIALLAALNHTGLVEEGKFYFNAMQETYGIAPNVDHVSCIVDLLGRARRVKEAEEYMEKYSFEQDPVVLGCLLSACRVHGDLVVGKRTAERFLQIQKVSTSPYVLLSNLYASESMWDGVLEARKQLKDSLMKKEPGHSLIEVKGAVEKFTVGRISHPRIEEIMGLLQILSFAEDGFSCGDQRITSGPYDREDDWHVLIKKAETFELRELQKILVNRQQLSVLEKLLNDAYVIRRPKPSEYENRKQVIRVLNDIAKDLYGFSASCPVVEEFGSFSMDLFTAESDLDLSINFPNTPFVFPREQKIKTLRKFAKKLYSLQSAGRVQKVQTVMGAKVPILKFVDTATGVECDVSVENMDGISKSLIIRYISSIDERFQKLSLLMKAWAKAHDINSPKDQTLSSLSIILLVSFHLQTRDPPILPPFSAILKDGDDPASVKNSVRNFQNYGRRNTETLGELFVSFLIKLASVEELWSKGLCASSYLGRWTSKTWDHKIAIMSVEDFFDRAQNVARAVGKIEVKIIHSSIRLTIQNLSRFMNVNIEELQLKESLFGSVYGMHHLHAEPNLIIRKENYEKKTTKTNLITNKVYNPNGVMNLRAAPSPSTRAQQSLYHQLMLGTRRVAGSVPATQQWETASGGPMWTQGWGGGSGGPSTGSLGTANGAAFMNGWSQEVQPATDPQGRKHQQPPYGNSFNAHSPPFC